MAPRKPAARLPKLKRVRKKKPANTEKKKEMTILGSALRNLGGLGGSAIGSLFGMPGAGASAGSSLGATISKWLGSGNYAVKSNSIVSNVVRGSDAIPAMHNEGQSVIVRHKEFVTEIVGSTAFTVQATFGINPGNSVTFPWLSQIAANFQEYKIRGLVFHYVPSSGNAVSATNAALGTVMIQTSYRANDAAPASKVEMLNEFWSSEAVPSEPFCHPLECDPKENPFNVQYVRTGNVPTNDNTLLYDLGQTFVATSGQQANGNTLGDLWVTYEIELKKPLIASNVTPDIPVSVQSVTGGTPSGTTLFPTGSVFTTQYGSLAMVLNANSNKISFGAGLVGTYIVVLQCDPSTNFTVADMGGNVTRVNNTSAPLDAASDTLIRNQLGGTSPTLIRAMRIDGFTVTNPSLATSITYPTLSLTGTISDVTVMCFRVA